jgi:hypothetical protein
MRWRPLTALIATTAIAGPALAADPSAAEPEAVIAPEATRAAVLAVEVEEGAGGLDAGELRASIAREAAVRVSDAATTDGPRLVIKGRGPSALSFELLEGGRTVERTIELPDGSAAKRLSTAALVAASLLEDDAAELLARLRAEAKKTAPPEPPKPPIVAVQKEKPPPVPPPLPPCKPQRPDLLRWFGADAAPHAGMSAFERPGTVRRISLELFGSGVAGVRGIEASPFVTVNGGFICGLQVSGLGGWNAGYVRGVQASGLGSWASEYVRGVQLSGILSVTTHRVTGAQIATVTMASEVVGAQLGVVNIAGEVHGAQLGIVNIARKSDASIGVFSLVTEGRTTLHGFGGSDGVISLAVQHGGRVAHNYYGGAISVAGKEGLALGPTIGLGAHVYEGARAFVDIDALAHLLFSPSAGGNMQTLLQGRIAVGLKLAPSFALYVAPFYDVLHVNTGQAPRAYDGAVFKRTVDTGGGTLHLSPGIAVGVRAL